MVSTPDFPFVCHIILLLSITRIETVKVYDSRGVYCHHLYLFLNKATKSPAHITTNLPSSFIQTKRHLLPNRSAEDEICMTCENLWCLIQLCGFEKISVLWWLENSFAPQSRGNKIGGAWNRMLWYRPGVGVLDSRSATNKSGHTCGSLAGWNQSPTTLAAMGGRERVVKRKWHIN